MNSSRSANLEETIRRSGEGWLIDWHDPKSEALDHVRRVLGDVDQRAKDRLGGDAPDLSEQALLAEYERNPMRVKAYFQAVGSSCTPDMLLMAWRIIQGMEIKSVNVTYHRRSPSEMRVILESHGEEDAPYISSNMKDFKIFRHIGILNVGDMPILDGFYPLRLK